jgi:hypothetical protein
VGDADWESSIFSYLQLLAEMGVVCDNQITLTAESKPPEEKPIPVVIRVGETDFTFPVLEKEITHELIVNAMSAKFPDLSTASHSLSNTNGLVLLFY